MEDAEDRSVSYGYLVQDAQPRRFKSHSKNIRSFHYRLANETFDAIELTI